jgi:hypothetical protein
MPIENRREKQKNPFSPLHNCRSEGLLIQFRYKTTSQKCCEVSNYATHPLIPSLAREPFFG